MFYLAISMVGTDFSMIAQLLTHRSRAEIKVQALFITNILISFTDLEDKCINSNWIALVLRIYLFVCFCLFLFYRINLRRKRK